MPIVSVLWGLSLLTAVSLSLLWGGGMSYGLAHNSLEIAEINAIADAGINRAVAAVLEQQPERRWRLDGTPQHFDFNGVPMTIAIQDELGKIDLNQAEPALLSGLLQSAGLDPLAANSLADKIVDWRTAVPFKRVNGAKEEDYRAAGLSYRPRNGPFQSVGELLLVMDVTPALFERIAPALTVYSGRPQFDPQVAPAEALQALPGMTPQGVQSTLSSRAGMQPAADISIGNRLAALRGRAFTIRTEFVLRGRPFVRQAILRLTENPNEPYWVLDWKNQ